MASIAASTEAPLVPGTRLGGRFRIEAALGRGGMATVYRAVDERSGAVLALKHLRAGRDGDGPLIAAQLEREYHTLCQLHHPGIVAVHDYGIEQGTPFYTMELLEGDDLHHTGKLAWQAACAILREVASSLSVLHSRRLLHRDISTRNVRRDSSGRVKLIDFGAMMVMGVSKQLVGTPPFVPPEAAQLQSLDGRADLYSLGALAYFLLTGYHAYHARSLGQLRTLWRSPALPVREYAGDVPPALDALVSELLQLDRGLRPARAAEVIERLSAIAGLPLSELPAVTRAYLTTPRLVGRKTQLESLRDGVLAALRGPGRCFMLTGPAGSGRSRMLDAGVLEAKLQGAIVLRADAADALGGDFGAARSLCQQLLVELPELSERGKEFPRAVLAHIVPQWSEQRARAAPSVRALHAACRAWFSWIARERPLLIAVDDFESIDAPSAALLATLAQASAQSPLSLLLAVRSGGQPSAAVSLMQEFAQFIQLTPLDAVQTEALMRSVFGDVAHAAPLSSRIHALAQGNPRATLALCERLVERGAARYEGGSWQLPANLTPADIPQTLAALLRQRIEDCSDDARELAEALAITDPAAHAPPDYVLLTHHGDAERCYAALQALVASNVLVPLGDRHRFADDALAELLRAELDPQRARELHRRIAAIMPPAADQLVIARHMLLGGREAEAIELLARQPYGALLARSVHALSTLEQAVLLAEQVQAPLSQQILLRAHLVGAAAFRGEYAVFTRYAWSLLERLLRDSGLQDYLELHDELNPDRRQAESARRVQQRYTAASDRDRPLPLQEAAYRLGTLYGAVSTMLGLALDQAMLERLPSLAPLYHVAKNLELADLGVDVGRCLKSGDMDGALSLSLRFLSRLERPEAVGMTPEVAAFVRRVPQFFQGLAAAVRGSGRALEWADELQHESRYRFHAWRVRMVYELSRGNVAMAASCERRAELLQLQEGVELLPGMTLRSELLGYVGAGDLIGVKRMLEPIRIMAEAYPGWRSTLALARSHYHRLQGDLAVAFEVLQPALAICPGQHIDFPYVAFAHATLLNLLGRTDEALRVIEAYCGDDRWAPGNDGYWMLEPYAVALSAAGQHDRAWAAIQRRLAAMTEVGIQGLIRATTYEVAARIALARQDQHGFTDCIELCAREYRGGARNPLFCARYEVLVRQAEAMGMHAPRPTAPPVRTRAASEAPRAPKRRAETVE